MDPRVPCFQMKQKKPCNSGSESPQAEKKEAVELWDVYERPWERNPSLRWEQFMSNMRSWLTFTILQRDFLGFGALNSESTAQAIVHLGRQLQFVILAHELHVSLWNSFNISSQMWIAYEKICWAIHFLKFGEHVVVCITQLLFFTEEGYFWPNMYFAKLLRREAGWKTKSIQYATYFESMMGNNGI